MNKNINIIYRAIYYIYLVNCFYLIVCSTAQSQIIDFSNISMLKDNIYEVASSDRPITHIIPAIKHLGAVGAETIVEILSETDDEHIKIKLLLLLGAFEEDAHVYLPVVMDIIRSGERMRLTEDKFNVMLLSFDTAALIDNGSIELRSHLTKAISNEYWDTNKIPLVVKNGLYDNSVEYIDPEIVRIRLRKHIINGLATIADDTCIRVLEEYALKEEQGGDKQLSYVFSWTIDYIKKYGSIKNYYKEINVILD